MRRREHVSIACVFNDPDVRRECLDRSVELHRHEAPETELIAIDNTGHRYPSAGAALNHAARVARHPYVAFVHQDVYLHSLVALEEAAGLLSTGGFALLGATGVCRNGRLAGRIRDRIVLTGTTAREPIEVDSIDEVLFIAARRTVLDAPLSEENDLAWHAYAVEYGLRMTALGRRIGAIQIPITHNSLTVNLARLDAGHQAVARTYPTLLPIQTTCGRIPPKINRATVPPLLARHRWRYRWAKDSLALRPVMRILDDIPIVRSDIRHEIDEILSAYGKTLRIVNVDHDGGFLKDSGPELMLTRGGRTVTFATASPFDLTASTLRVGQSLLLTNLEISDLPPLLGVIGNSAKRVGFHEHAGLWLAAGEIANVEIAPWRTSQARPWRFKH